MYKTSMAFLVLGSLISTPSFSSGFIQKILPPAENAVHETMLSNKTAKTTTGTDFSGQWIGTCAAGNEGVTTMLSIKNTDYDIEIEGQYYGIGNMITEGHSNIDWYKNNQFKIAWNSEKDTLTINGVVVENFQHKSASFNTNIYKLTLALKNDQLIYKGNFITYKNLKVVKKDAIDCKLNRQS